jgi:hypothetical protein
MKTDQEVASTPQYNPNPQDPVPPNDNASPEQIAAKKNEVNKYTKEWTERYVGLSIVTPELLRRDFVNDFRRESIEHMNETRLKKLWDLFRSQNVLVRSGRGNSKVRALIAIHEAENFPFTHEENTTDESAGEQDIELGTNEITETSKIIQRSK